MTAVLACERCRTRYAVVYDTYADVVGCGTCYPGEPPSSYDCEFVLSYIPERVAAEAHRPTIEISEDVTA